jgi:hypothetical protein
MSKCGRSAHELDIRIWFALFRLALLCLIALICHVITPRGRVVGGVAVLPFHVANGAIPSSSAAAAIHICCSLCKLQ